MASVLKRAGEVEPEIAAKKAAVEVPPKVVQEPDVGITQYVNKSAIGFFGTIKSRYSDFQVFELDQEGHVVHLTDRGPILGASSKEKRQEKRKKALEDRETLEKVDGDKVETLENGAKSETKNEVEDVQVNEIGTDTTNGEAKNEALKSEDLKNGEANGDAENGKENGAENGDTKNGKAEDPVAQVFKVSPEYRARLSEHLSAEEIEQIEKVVSEGGSMETSTQFPDKTIRTLLHQLFRQAFDGKVDTSTSEANTVKISTSNPKNGRKNNHVNHVDENGIVNYGLGPYKNYLHFTVYKENRETMEVANTITKFMRIPNKSVKYSGTKDRRGVTCQRFCIHKAKVARVTSLNKALKGTVLGGFAYSDRGLDLGDLAGNEFVIAIRDVRVVGGGDQQDLSSVVHQSFSGLQSTGFINYYGLQRFGTFSVSTHVLGIYLLREDWKGAVELILAEQERVVPDSVNARRIWAETGNAAEALKQMPRRCSAEHAVLTVLAKNKPGNPYTTDMYFRAILNIPRNLRLIYVHAYQSYIWNLVASKRVELFGLSVQEGDLVYAKSETDESGEVFEEDVAGASGAAKVHVVTAQDVQTAKYSIYDVVLPSPGCDVQYPGNQQLMEVYETAMKKDSLDPHKMARKIKEFSLAGSYRTVLARARDVSYEITHYKEDEDSVLYTDLEMLEKRDNGDLQQDVTQFSQRVIPPPECASKTAVILRMKLGVSSYATMALREFMKADTLDNKEV